MIEAVVGLLMFWDGEIKEAQFTRKHGRAFAARRIAERDYNPNISYKAYVVKQKQRY